MADTLTDLYRRNEAFWIGLSAVVLGAVAPETLAFGKVGLSRTLVVGGGGLLITSFFVGIYRLLSTT